MITFSAVPASQGSAHAQGLDVSGYARQPYALFSPACANPLTRIPVPGQRYTSACSVESIWQGLKVIGGRTAFDMFLRRPRKRAGTVEGHLLGDTIIGYAEARRAVFRPSYFHYLEHYVPESAKEAILERAFERDGVAFFDVCDNVDPADLSAPLAHSAYLAEYFNEFLDLRLSELGEELSDCLRVDPPLSVEAAAARLFAHYAESPPVKKRLIQCLTGRPVRDLATRRIYAEFRDSAGF